MPRTALLLCNSNTRNKFVVCQSYSYAQDTAVAINSYSYLYYIRYSYGVTRCG